MLTTKTDHLIKFTKRSEHIMYHLWFRIFWIIDVLPVIPILRLEQTHIMTISKHTHSSNERERDEDEDSKQKIYSEELKKSSHFLRIWIFDLLWG
jgi:hypothetical protein